MFDTYITVVGTVLNRPEKRIIQKSDTLVASFRVASNPRRYDRVTQQWVDSPGLRIKVHCWRRLAEGVCVSLIAGDPVVVYGRISTREWKNEQGETRFSYEMDADTVGHDLSRGVAEFKKIRAEMATSVVEDEDSENRVNGELAVSLDDLGASGLGEPTHVGIETSYDDFPYGSIESPDAEVDAMAILRNAGLDPASPDPEEGDDDADEEASSGATVGSGGATGRSRRRGRQPVPA